MGNKQINQYNWFNDFYFIALIIFLMTLCYFLGKKNVALNNGKSDLLHENEMLRIELKRCELNKPLKL